MELQLVNQRNDVVVSQKVPQSSTEYVDFTEIPATVQEKKVKAFVEANTTPVTLTHLKNDCIIPVFRDNEKTISHYEFIDAVEMATHEYFRGMEFGSPEIRVSHTINGRIPQALHKKVHELEDYEKTRYYERMMFIIEIPSIMEEVNGNQLSLTVGGVRALNHESLFSKKTIERFKVFIGFQNKVCCNLMVCTDGVALDMRVASYDDLFRNVYDLFAQFRISRNLSMLQNFGNYSLTEHQFAQIIGKSRLYQFLPADERKLIPSLEFNDTQINSIARDYYFDGSFCRNANGDIDLWRLHNLFTGANKSSYIDSFLPRAVNATTFTQTLVQALEDDPGYNWFLR